MISNDEIKALVLETIQSPRSAARKIMGLHLSRDVLWTAMGLVAAINSIIYSFSIFLAGTDGLPALLSNPILFFVVITGILVVTVHVFHWAGHAMGGRGDLGELLVLLVWLQALRAVAQAVMFFLLLLAPVLGQIFSLGVGVLGLWVTVNFITEAQRKESLSHGVGVLVLSAVGIIFGLMILVALISVASMGVPANV